jgi:predicted RNA-binding Zn-ribbon protein involved in translation (DUF1610 family)
MAKKIRNIRCVSCKEEISAVPKRTPAGFSKFECPKCKSKFVYPLTNPYRVVYFILGVVFWVQLIRYISVIFQPAFWRSRRFLLAHGEFLFLILGAALFAFIIIKDIRLVRKTMPDSWYEDEDRPVS